MASKGRMGIQGAIDTDTPPDTSLVEFQWPAKAGWGFRTLVGVRREVRRPLVSMASKGRMGIQGQSSHSSLQGWKFQWPAKAGWGFRHGGGRATDKVLQVSMASKGRMGIQAGAPRRQVRGV